MIQRSKINFIKSLHHKKYRTLEKCFIVEGEKGVNELIQSDFQLLMILGTSIFISEKKTLLASLQTEMLTVSERQLNQLSTFQSNKTVMAVVRQKSNQPVELKKKNWTLVLDTIRDPGNLGTIIRTADWFGIKQIIASESTVEFYNPKVIRATMGSFTRIQPKYVSLPAYLSHVLLPIVGLSVTGHPLYTMEVNQGGLIVVGNESTGITPEVSNYIKHHIAIPKKGDAESLNASIAVGIALDNITRLRYYDKSLY